MHGCPLRPPATKCLNHDVPRRAAGEPFWTNAYEPCPNLDALTFVAKSGPREANQTRFIHGTILGKHELGAQHNQHSHKWKAMQCARPKLNVFWPPHRFKLTHGAMAPSLITHKAYTNICSPRRLQWTNARRSISEACISIDRVDRLNAIDREASCITHPRHPRAQVSAEGLQHGHVPRRRRLRPTLAGAKHDNSMATVTVTKPPLS